MSFLGRLATRVLDPAATLQPRLRSRFEPSDRAGVVDLPQEVEAVTAVTPATERAQPERPDPARPLTPERVSEARPQAPPLAEREAPSAEPSRAGDDAGPPSPSAAGPGATQDAPTGRAERRPSRPPAPSLEVELPPSEIASRSVRPRKLASQDASGASGAPPRQRERPARRIEPPEPARRAPTPPRAESEDGTARRAARPAATPQPERSADGALATLEPLRRRVVATVADRAAHGAVPEATGDRDGAGRDDRAGAAQPALEPDPGEARPERPHAGEALHVGAVPTVHVTIGRVEVRAQSPAPAPAAQRRRREPKVMSLEEYLKQHAGERR